MKWQSYNTITYEQRQQFEKMLSDCINGWNDWLAGYENWPYEHIDVKIVGWAVIDSNCLLDLHDDEVVYTDTMYYDSQYDTTNGRDEIPDREPYAPWELSRFEHFSEPDYEYPGGADNRFDMYMWATQGFPDIGGCGGDWGQRLSDTAYFDMIENGSLHVLEHEIGHGFGLTDFYGGEGEADGFPPGGFPGGENSIMMAGSATKITDFDGWLLRYVWTKIKDDEGRFDLTNTPPDTEELNRVSFGAENSDNPCYPFESISAFYNRASKGSMQFYGQVFRYTTRENQSAYDTDKVKLAEECYEAFREQVDFSQFDGNNDGVIDATLFTVPTKAGDDDWWPCAGAFGDPDYRVDGMSIGHIITGNAQIESEEDYVNYISSYCHELGHCTGLPDYYLYSNPDDSEGLHGRAGIELMDTDAGSDFGAFSKLMEGWYRQEQVRVYDASQGTQTFLLNNAQTDSGNCVIIPNGQLADDYFSEYFIVEYATKDGNNSGIGRNVALWESLGEGIRIYHIDATTGYGWNTFFRYASGSEFTNQDNERRLIRIIDDTDTDNFYHTGDVINGNISGFHWYDSDDMQTVDTGITITVGECNNGTYEITINN